VKPITRFTKPPRRSARPRFPNGQEINKYNAFKIQRLLEVEATCDLNPANSCWVSYLYETVYKHDESRVGRMYKIQPRGHQEIKSKILAACDFSAPLEFETQSSASHNNDQVRTEWPSDESESDQVGAALYLMIYKLDRESPVVPVSA